MSDRALNRIVRSHSFGCLVMSSAFRVGGTPMQHRANPARTRRMAVWGRAAASSDVRLWRDLAVPAHRPERQLSPTVSTGQRNTFIKSLSWGLEVQCFPWPFVEFTRHAVELGLGERQSTTGPTPPQLPMVSPPNWADLVVVVYGEESLAGRMPVGILRKFLSIRNWRSRKR